MFLKQLLLFIVIVGVAVFLLNIKAIFRKNGRLERSCTAKHRMMHEKGIECSNCAADPTVCDLDIKEHDSFIHSDDHSK